jgi:hypothetical protein
MAGTVFVLALSTANLMAQRGQGGGRGGFGDMDPDEIRALVKDNAMQNYQEALGFPDDEWVAISPIVEKVYDAQLEANTGNIGRGGFGRGGRGGQGGRGGRGGRGGFGQDPMPELVALQEALASEDTSSDEIREKLAALREAREKNEKALADARSALKEVLTVRQEAAAVTMGLLE